MIRWENINREFARSVVRGDACAYGSAYIWNELQTPQGRVFHMEHLPFIYNRTYGDPEWWYIVQHCERIPENNFWFVRWTATDVDDRTMVFMEIYEEDQGYKALGHAIFAQDGCQFLIILCSAEGVNIITERLWKVEHQPYTFDPEWVIQFRGHDDDADPNHFATDMFDWYMRF